MPFFFLTFSRLFQTSPVLKTCPDWTFETRDRKGLVQLEALWALLSWGGTPEYIIFESDLFSSPEYLDRQLIDFSLEAVFRSLSPMLCYLVWQYMVIRTALFLSWFTTNYGHKSNCGITSLNSWTAVAMQRGGNALNIIATSFLTMKCHQNFNT